MKKRLCALVSAAAVALGGAFGLVACGDDGGNKDDGVLKSDKVASAAAWADAMDFSDVTNGTISISGMEDCVDTILYDGNKVKRTFESLDGTESETRYYEYRENEPYPGADGRGTEYCYFYDEERSKWVVEASPLYDFDLFDHFFDDAIDEILEVYNEVTGEYEGKLSERYSDFTYDDGKYAYVATFENLDYMKDVETEVKFKNGKVVEGSFKGTYEYEEQTETIEVTFKIYDLGTTTVTFPQVDD